MKKLIISAILMLSCGQLAIAQQNSFVRSPKLGIGLEGALGPGKYGSGYFLQFQSPIAANLNWTASVGKTNLQSTQKVYPARKYENFVPKVGARYFLNERVYVAGEVGAAFDQIQRRTTRFAWSSGIGVELNIFGESALDIGGKYEAYESANTVRFFALRAALNLGL